MDILGTVYRRWRVRCTLWAPPPRKDDARPETVGCRRRDITRWSGGSMSDLTSLSSPLVRFPNACPCCGYDTLDERGDYDICRICWWEDDGQDNHNATAVLGGPNACMSLARARINYLTAGISDPTRTDLLIKRLSTKGRVQQREFVFDEVTSRISEPALVWSVTIRELDEDRSRPLYAVGDRVDVQLNGINRTPGSGTIHSAIWHFKMGIWHYWILDDKGRKVSKRYASSDLIPAPDRSAQ